MTAYRDDARFRHLAQRVHQLGARSIMQLLAELAEIDGHVVVERMEAYARELIATFDGRELKALPLVQPGGRAGLSAHSSLGVM